MMFLGEQVHASGTYHYFLNEEDGYVYQAKNGQKEVWFCSFAAWEHALHRIVEE